MQVTIHGDTSPQFEPVKETFMNLWQDIEVGAGFCVFHQGQKVVDLWAGFKDPKMTQSWQSDTLVNIYSTTKGLASLAFAILVDEGKVHYEDKVIDHWPEFGAKGKHQVTIAQLLSHQAGLCGVETTITVADLYDWDKMITLLASQKPLWPLGEGSGYHAITWGYFPGELIRRLTGKTLGQYFDEKVRRPLDADCYIGLPDREIYRCATLIGPNRARKKPALETANQPSKLYPIALLNPAIRPFRDACSDQWRKSEIASANAQASARGIATVYGALSMGGILNGTRIISPDAISAATQIEVDREIDLVTGRTMRRSRGFILNDDGAYGPNPGTFGHSGAGGSLGYADQEAQIGFAYAMNQMQADPRKSPRSRILTEAVFSCL